MLIFTDGDSWDSQLTKGGFLWETFNSYRGCFNTVGQLVGYTNQEKEVHYLSRLLAMHEFISSLTHFFIDSTNAH